MFYTKKLLLFGVRYPESTNGTDPGGDCTLTMVHSQTQQCIVDYEQAHDQAWVNAKYNVGLRERARTVRLASRSTGFSTSPNRRRLASPPHPSPTMSSLITICEHLT